MLLVNVGTGVFAKFTVLLCRCKIYESANWWSWRACLFNRTNIRRTKDILRCCLYLMISWVWIKYFCRGPKIAISDAWCAITLFYYLEQSYMGLSSPSSSKMTSLSSLQLIFEMVQLTNKLLRIYLTCEWNSSDTCWDVPI